jgi:hypothetical protein
VIDRTGNVAAVYAAIGALTAIIAIAFSFSPIGHAERYLPAEHHDANAPAPSPAMATTK